MTQYHAHKNLDPESRKSTPYWLDIQHEVLNKLDTRVVIPLYLSSEVAISPVKNLNPSFTIQDRRYVAMAQLMLPTETAYLGSSVADFSDQSHIITNAIDAVLSGI
jgi:toxin CcdB